AGPQHPAAATPARAGRARGASVGRDLQPGADGLARLVHAQLRFAGERLHAHGVAPALAEVAAHRLHHVAGGAARELVGLGQQRVRGQAALHRVAEHVQVVVLERMADVHHHHQPAQRQAGAEVVVDEGLPVLAQVLRHLGVAVAGQVHQVAALVLRQLEEHQLLRAARGLGHARQRVLLAERVERGGLAGVGAPGEGDLEAAVLGQLPRDVGREQVLGAGTGIGHAPRIARRAPPLAGFARLAGAPGNGRALRPATRPVPGTPEPSPMRHARSYVFAGIAALAVGAVAFAQTTVAPLEEAEPVEALPLEAVDAVADLARTVPGNAQNGAALAATCAACHG